MIWTKTILPLLVDIEPWLNLIALLAVLRAGVSKRFPAMTFYLGVRCLTDASLYFILKERHFLPVSVHTWSLTYVYTYWASYLLGAIAIFFVLQEVFKAVMEPVPGLQRLGLIVFRWISIASVSILLGMSILPTHKYGGIDVFFMTIDLQIMRCAAMLEICLLAYLALTVHSLGRSFRGRVFGIALGFGLQAAGSLICTLMYSKPGSIWNWANLVLMFATTSTVLVWTAYFLLPEPAEERNPITLPVTSPLLRWNDIASALGQQRPAHVALGSTSSAFFLQDVEQVVDKFLAKTP
jgi:hypothetical protein